MTNLQAETIKHIADVVAERKTHVLCVQIIDDYYASPTQGKVYQYDHSDEDQHWIDFLNTIDLNYDSGYGTQHYLGKIWYADGTWSTRSEYDGSEWWTHNACPPLPNPLPKTQPTN